MSNEPISEKTDWKGETLYHYTSIESCLAILQNSTFRMSNINYLNDSMEYFWIWETFKRVCKELGKDPAQLEWVRGTYAADYVFCFCESSDFLPLWRSYADDGRGVALGFEVAEDATGLFSRNSLRCDRVIYDVNEQERLVRLQIEKLGLINPSDLDGSDEFNDSIQKNINDVFLHINLNWYAPLFKNPGFESEKEWRLIFSHGPERLVAPKKSPPPYSFGFRTGSTNIIPFVELPILPKDGGVLRLRKIVFGPRNEVRADGAGIRELLKYKNMNPDEIEFARSTISFVG